MQKGLNCAGSILRIFCRKCSDCISKEQKRLLNKIKCIRVKECDDTGLLKSIVGPKVVNECRSVLIDQFRSEECINDDKYDKLASYLLISPNKIPLLFFSLRCGELFKILDKKKMILCHKAFVAISDMAAGKLSGDKLIEANRAVQEAIQYGCSVDEFTSIDIKKSYEKEVKKEPNKDINRVQYSFPAVEMKFYGINGSDVAREYWGKTTINNRIGVTLFWHFIIPKIEEICKLVGCEYVYLFAADKDPDGTLVNYYRNVLKFDSDPSISANKPFFDSECIFLYQTVDELKKQRDCFFSEFNSDKK